jgi:hypothetical protein
MRYSFATKFFVLVERSYPAPKSKGGKYRRPVYLAIVDTREQDPTKPLRKGIVTRWDNLDSRYRGPRSAYGMARAEAEARLNELNG